jgi:hypothetical protein
MSVAIFNQLNISSSVFKHLLSLVTVTSHSAEVQEADGRHGCAGSEIRRLLRSRQRAGDDTHLEIKKNLAFRFPFLFLSFFF